MVYNLHGYTNYPILYAKKLCGSLHSLNEQIARKKKLGLQVNYLLRLAAEAMT
jgi:hypothetical protein